ncbi:MAG: M3 family oligoendopeptidase, partial [Acetobacter sp.]|nr:M3 family oligoendopeptidase [Acetobacter sp.]
TEKVTDSSRSMAQVLPRWDLSDLYTGMDDPALTSDRTEVERLVRDFSSDYQGKIVNLTAAELAEALDRFEVIEEIRGRLSSFASLLFAQDSSDAVICRFSQSVNEQLTMISVGLLFFPLELNRLEDDSLQRKLDMPELSRWKSYLRDIRLYRPHQLSDEIEKVLLEKSLTGNQAWCRLFDETIASLRISLDGREVTMDEALNGLSDVKRSVREKTGHAIATTLHEKIRLFSLITNTLVSDKAITDKLRHYPRSTSERNLSNMVEDEVVETLVSTVRSEYPRLSHRYYSLKAKWLGIEKLEYWDRNAPLPGEENNVILWKEACSIVQKAYDVFDPRLGKIVSKFLKNPWIDAAPVQGKASGAFAHSTVPSVHPYILLNYYGKIRDVMTLAHEIGHGVHQILAARQGYLMSQTPLTLAETASVFGEMLTFQSLLEIETDPQRYRRLLAGKVEDMLNTVVRQIAFYEFEKRIHEERRHGELLPEKIGEIWHAVQTESLGPAFHLAPEYQVFWAYIPHFIHSPFYVY